MERQITAALLFCLACGSNDDSSGARSPDHGAEQSSAGQQALSENFRLVPEFDGCGVGREDKADDLAEFGFAKSDLLPFFGSTSSTARDSSGAAQSVSLRLEWADSSAVILETHALPSDDDFAPDCPEKTVALATNISFTSDVTGTVTANSFLFTKDGTKASGAVQATAKSGKTYFLTIIAHDDGSTKGVLSEVVLSEVATSGRRRETQSLLEW